MIKYIYYKIEKIKLHNTKPGALKFGRLTPGFNKEKHF
nr:Hypothetical protein pJMR5-4_0004 [Clostridioides difficile]